MKNRLSLAEKLPSSKRFRNRQSSYNIVQNDTRRDLMDLIYNKGLTIKDAALQIGINYSTAKSIITLLRK